MTSGLTVLCAAKLHKNQLERHLELFEYIPEVERVIVLRHAHAGEQFSKTTFQGFSPGLVPVHAIRMAREIRRVLTRERVDLVVGLNPAPWGSVAMAAARSCGVRSCVSLIGRDFLQIQKWWGGPFLEAVRRADAVTVTGKQMLTGLVDLGVEREKITILPHSVDTVRFSPRRIEREFDLISVGQLVERKRMDVLIEAVALLACTGRRLRLGILGKGPKREELRRLACARGVEDLVTFLDYRNDVENVLNKAPVFCLASNWEGVPFAMMEAMAAGLVPVVTDVGTIADWVVDGRNGLLLPPGNAELLAQRLNGLFDNDESEIKRLRSVVLSERESLSFKEGARAWRSVLQLK